MNIKPFGTAAIFQWTKEYLINVMSTGRSPVLTDPILINALYKIDRKDFVPSNYKTQAYADIDIDIGYDEKLSKPTAIIHMLALLKPKYGGKYLDIGTGTGYTAVVLGFVAGDQGKVYTIERIQWLWEQARMNSTKYKEVRNVDFLYRDGTEGLINQAPFDGIHIAFALAEVPEKLKMQLNQNGGRLVCPTVDGNVKVIERKGQNEFEEEIVQGFMFDKGKEGIA